MLSKQMRILSHLKSNKAITPIEALEHYGSMRLGAVIFDLRKDYDIVTEMVESRDRFGNPVRYAKYHYRGKIEPENNM